MKTEIENWEGKLKLNVERDNWKKGSKLKLKIQIKIEIKHQNWKLKVQNPDWKSKLYIEIGNKNWKSETEK